jgi:hypothetical protein
MMALMMVDVGEKAVLHDPTLTLINDWLINLAVTS